LSQQLVFRKFKADDLGALIKVFHSNVPAYFLPYEWEEFKGFLTKEEADDYYVALLNITVVGAGGIAKNNQSVSMCWGMIDSGYHHMGFGTQLLVFRMALAKKKFPNVDLELKTTQHTYRFFEKLGFELIDTQENFWGPALHLYLMKRNNG